MPISETLYLHAFNIFPKGGAGRLLLLMHSFASGEEFFEASPEKLEAAGLPGNSARDFVSFRQKFDPERELELLAASGIKLLHRSDPAYPALLREIARPPALLYYRGLMETPDELCIAVVGTRMITNYGRITAPLLLEPLLATGITIVSGLAFGVDALAQDLAVRHQKRTIAVLGGGLDTRSLYPKEHQLLADGIIAAGGALLSEYPPGTPPLKHHFLARNRILSGMSAATLVIECNLKSGSLITARYALEQNRTVLAVPGPIYSDASKGPNNLIKMGARPVTGASDILEELNLASLPEQQQTQELFGDSPEESAILKVLGFEPLPIDELIKAIGLTAAAVTSALTFLEMKGKVKNLGAQQYVRCR